MKKVELLLMFLLALSIAPFSSTGFALEVNQPAPNFTLTDTNGKQHSLADYKGKYVVLEWVNFECPFVKKHYQSNNMQKLQETYTAKDIVWLSINSSAEGKQGYYAAAQANEIISNANAKPTAYLLDTDGTVGKTYGAQTTPHMYVIDPQGKLIYQGAIDSIPSFDQEDIAKAENYVASVLASAMAGETPGVQSTKAYGCSVKY